MARYTGWRRLSGDTADRPDLLDLGKRLLGELDAQRRLSGVKTLTIERQAPDGSVVRAGFIYEHPFIDVREAERAPLNARRAIALRLVSYLVATAPTRMIRALVDLDYFDAETFEHVGSPRRVLAWADNGTGTPRTNFCFTSPSGQPYAVDEASQPRFLGVVLSNSFVLYDAKFQSLGGITNTLWTGIYGQAIGTGSETYETTAALPGGTMLTFGAARDATPAQNILPSLLFAIDSTTRQAVGGVKVSDLLGSEPNIVDFQASPTADFALVTHTLSSGGVSIARLIKVDAALNKVATLDLTPYDGAPSMAFLRDGSRVFLCSRIRSQQQYTIFVIDPATMTVERSRDFAIPSQGWLAQAPRFFLGASEVYCVTEDVKGPCLEVRRQDELEVLVRRIPLDALETQLTGVVFPFAWVVGPAEKRVYLYPVAGKIVVMDGRSGALLEAFNASTLKHNTGFSLLSFTQDNNFLTSTETTVSRNFFIAR